MENKEQLHDELCEQCVLGTILAESKTLNEVREFLTSDDFYDAEHADIYKAICVMADNGDVADMVTIMPKLKLMNSHITPLDIANLCDHYTHDIHEYALRLTDLSKRRKLATLGMFMYANGTTEAKDLNEVLTNIGAKLNELQSESASHLLCVGDLISDIDTRIADLRQGIVPDYTHTGFAELDKHRQFQPSNLIIIAADSSQGKTSLANCITLSSAANGCGVAYYSMEMTSTQQITRLISIDSDIPYAVLAYHPLCDNELKDYQASKERVAKLPIFFDDRSTSNIDTIIASIRSMVAKHHIGGVCIDYLQILNVNSRNSNTEQQLADVARRLKNLAKELNIWVMLLSQLSRNLDNPEPSLDRLRGSGQINEAADTTILLYRPQFYNDTYGKSLHFSGSCSSISTIGTAQINVAKGRNSGCYSFVCGFKGENMKFCDLNEVPLLPKNMQPQDNEPF